MTHSIFSDVRILDMATAGTGPLGLSWMAGYGATVIKVETHLRLDATRMGGPFYEYVPGPDRGGWYMWLNPSKYGITLNLNKPGARDLIKRVVTDWQPHIMAESFRPGVMKRWGLDYDSVKRLKPDIVYFSTCLEGQYGPHSQRLGYGGVSTSMSGVSHLVGWPDRPPAGLPLAYADFPSAGTGLIAVVSALIRQRRTGRGLHIDQSQYESNLYVLAGPLMEYAVNGRVMGGNGNRHPSASPHGVYPCEGHDRWIAIAVFTDEEWRSFCRVIGDPAWASESRFATLAGRKNNEDELDRLVGEWTKDFPTEQVEAMMQAEGVAANVVEDNKDIYDDPQMKHYGHFRELEHPVVGTIRSEMPPMRFSKSRDTHFRAPLLGEHNHYVLSQFLGMSDDEIADLYAEGVITTDADLPAPRKQED